MAEQMVNGGWYNGQQYWEGKLGAPGVIINPNQVGTGQPVSSEVNAQSDVAQGLAVGTIDKYLAEQTTKYYSEGGGQPPTNPDQVSPYLNDFQASQLGSGGDITTRMGEVKNLLAPSTPLPAPINRVEEYNQLRTQYGVSDLEKQLTDVNKQIADVQSLNEQRQYNAETGQVALGVIGGRQTEIQRQTNIQLDTLNRAKSVMVDELNTKYGIIKTMIDYTGLDYQDAVSAYDAEYKRNLDVYNIVSQEQDAAKAAARANLTTMTNLITSGNMNYSSLNSTQKLMINKLEAQAGLPIGFTSSLQMSPKDKVLFTSTNNGITQVGMLNSQGGVTVQSYGTSTGDNNNNVTLKNTFLTTASKTNTIQAPTGEWVGQFPQLVKQFAPTMSLQQIYQYYTQTDLYKKYGPPQESAQEIQQLYDYYRGK